MPYLVVFARLERCNTQNLQNVPALLEWRDFKPPQSLGYDLPTEIWRYLVQTVTVMRVRVFSVHDIHR